MNKQNDMRLFGLYRNGEKQKDVQMDTLYEWIRSGKYRKRVEAVREKLRMLASQGIASSDIEEYEELPTAEATTGMAVVTLRPADLQQMEQLRRRVNQFPQTLLSLMGADGQTLVVVMSYELTDGTLPANEHEAVLFQQYAYRRAADFVLASTGIKAEEHEPLNTFYLSWDEQAYCDPQSQAIRMEQPTEPLSDTTAPLLPSANSNPLERDILPGYTRLEMDITKFNAICHQLAFTHERTPDEYLLALATACCKAGIDQEVATRCLLNLGSFSDKEVLVRSTMQNAYQQHPLGTHNPIEPSVMHQQLLKDFLQRRYLFRRNTVTGDMEYQTKGKYILSWRPLTTEARNDINNAAIDEGIKVWPKDMDRLLGSSMVQDYDPVREWLNALPAWDGRDRLGEMADRVPTTTPGWRDNFKVWMRSMVSQWTSGANAMYGAQMVFMLIGRQGTRKSTFMRLLLPPELRPFYIDRIDFTNKKEALRALSRFLLINIDEYDQISASQSAYLKHLIQRADVKERRMYETTYQQLQRYAAFCATTNSPTPLKDQTGSRRYMVVEVSGAIDTDTNGAHAIDYRQLYAQIKEELQRGEESCFTGERERMIMEQSANYQVVPNVVEMFDDLFRKPEAGDEVLALSPTEILHLIDNSLHVNVNNQSNTVCIGNYLKQQGFDKGSGRQRRKYLVAAIGNLNENAPEA